jgi:twin arginine-targeting protein translocase, TatA/E family
MLELKLANFGVWELVLILLIVVVIFGVGKLPQLGDALGRSIRNFKKAYHDEPPEIPGQVRRVEGSEDRDRLSSPQGNSPLNPDQNSKSKTEHR